MAIKLDPLWQAAREMTQGAMRRADSAVNGTDRARRDFERLGAAERWQMQRVVTEKYGQTAWDDFIQAIGKEKDNGTR